MTDTTPSGPDDDGARTAALRDRWREALVAARSGAPGPDPLPYADNLLARWAEPQRRYHTAAHLAAVLDHVDTLAAHADDPAAVRLAAWFHDAVYRPDRTENEERSAALAERALPEAGVPAPVTAEVARLVRLTVTHDPADGDRNGEVLCDADLAILAGGPRSTGRTRHRCARSTDSCRTRRSGRAGRRCCGNCWSCRACSVRRTGWRSGSRGRGRT